MDSDCLGEMAVGSGRSRTEGKQTHLRYCTDMVMPTHLPSLDVDRLLFSVFSLSRPSDQAEKRSFPGSNPATTETEPNQTNLYFTGRSLQGPRVSDVPKSIKESEPSGHRGKSLCYPSRGKGPSGLSFWGRLCRSWGRRTQELLLRV